MSETAAENFSALGMLLTIATLPEPKAKTLERLEEIAYEPVPAKVRTQPGLAR